MKDIGEIKAAIRSFRSDTTWLKLKSRWEDDFSLYRLKPYDAGKGYFSYTSNSPRNLASKGIGMLTEAKLLIRVPEGVLKEEERETASNVERFFYGAINMNDQRLGRMPDMPSIQNQMAWYAVLRGAFALRALVKKEEDGSTFLELAVWDIYNTAYVTGANGVLWAAHTRKASREQIKAEYGITIAKKVGDIIDFWDKEQNGVIVDSQWGKELEDHGVEGGCPVYIIRVGAMPPVWQENYEHTGAHIGESIFAANRGLYPAMDKTISDLLTLVRRGVKVPLGYWSAGARKTIEEDIFQTDKAAVLPMDATTEEKIEPLITPTMPADAGTLVNIISGEEQRGGLSHIAQGELGFRLSGFAINQLQASLSTVIVPFAEAVERGFEVGCLSLLRQYAKGGFKPVEVRGRTSTDQMFGVPKPIKIAPKDIDGSWHPEFRLEPILPKDDVQRYLMAREATQGDRPLLSIQTARDTLLEIPDTALEDERVAQEWAQNLPTIRLYKAFLAALADGQTDLAYNIVSELQQMMARTQQGGGGGTPPSRLSAAGGAPGGATGVPSSAMPSEALGGTPGAAANAQLPLFGEM